MEPVQLFQLAAKRNEWLSVRQSVVADNVANANTPGFKSRDVEAFSDTLAKTGLTVERTQAGHLAAAPADLSGVDVQQERSWTTVHSGNTVSLEQELLKANEVRGAFSLNTSIVKAFHRMILTSAKG